ncbi:sulfurtransferase [Vibrio hippocampi]|uniref:3-mercaptopyruvate sulfurtransferase n=1 Tax=Vibrio hippocampi TaxID=654686 RepID=A0ABM8ZMF0_9VIBR|nr:sulfurtransferase [Vibrio hippocampi]CAH0529719.1 3-mercaptopyruvate sulfurtransferase [Vibrio hippocampi]
MSYSPLVSAEWLQQQLSSSSKPIVLDASIEFQIPLEPEKITHGVIPDAMRFDYDTVFCDPESSLPHTMPSETRFHQLLNQFGIQRQSVVVVYDNSGTYASPRAWWMLKAMGIDQVYILDGGLPAWCEAGFALQDRYRQPAPTESEFQFEPSYFIGAQQVCDHIDNPASQIVDARSLARFQGTAPEPREGMRSGHIPTSVCLPFAQFLDQGKLKTVDQLQPLFASIATDRDTLMVFSCGSGITACILALGAFVCGYRQLSVYDGSWSEWGQRPDLPIER